MPYQYKFCFNLFSCVETVLERKDNVKAVSQRSCVKKLLLKILPDSKEITCARISFLIELQLRLRPATLLKKDSGTDIFLSILRNF